MARAWYSYTGQGSVLFPDNYAYSSSSPTCINGRTVCAVYALYNGTLTPTIISNNLAVYISSGITTGLPQPITPVGTKRYVYFLPVA